MSKYPKYLYTTLTLLIAMSLILQGCGDESEEAGSGSLKVLIDTEDLLINGLEAGDRTENIKDGWSASFNKYLVAVGGIDAHLSTDKSVEIESSQNFVLDLTKASASGFELWSFDNVREGRWEFNYQTVGAGDGAEKDASVDQADFDEMAGNDWTYLIEGKISNANGQSCPPVKYADPGDKMPNQEMSADIS